MSDEKRTLSHLERREIEAKYFNELKGPLLERLGREGLTEVMTEALCEASRCSGTETAKLMGNDMEAMRKVVEEWTTGEALDIEFQEETPEILRFSVRRCVYAETYEKLGIRDWGTVLSCQRDFAFVEGFNPNIELTRTKTLMEGKDCCDFCYRRKKEPEHK